MEDETGAVAHRPNYSAFISYSHADAEVVRKLHAKLEAYRLPKGLGRIDALNSRKSGLGKVFRDREDLSAAQSLSDAVTDALTRSEVLVVVCSPDAKASRWVGQEIAHFRKHSPGKPILAAIVRGDPEEAFPDALTEGGVEPLAADLRDQGDGWKLGFLKVVAGIAGVPLDALVQRDSQRQMRRVMAVTGVTALVAVAMGAMTMVALQARGEAEEQRDAAERLVEFMLTDLRDDLEGVGRLDIMDNVSGEALEYYELQEKLDTLSGESLLRRARVMEMIGRDLERRLNYSQAEMHYRELFRTTKELVTRSPNDPERILDHAWSENRLATFAASKDELEGVHSKFDSVLVSLKKIEIWGDSKKRWWRVFSIASSNKCAAGVLESAPNRAVGVSCRDAVDSARRILEFEDSPDGKYNLAYNLYWLAKFQEIKNNHAKSESISNESLSINSQLISSDPSNAKYQNQRMEILGGLYVDDEELNILRLEEAIKIADDLLNREPEDSALELRRNKYMKRLENLYE